MSAKPLAESPLASLLSALPERGELQFPSPLRCLILSEESLAAIFDVFREFFGEGYRSLLYNLGHAIGHRFAVEASGDPRKRFQELADVDALAGWGRYELVELDLENRRARVVVRNALAVEIARRIRSDCCDFTRGYFAGIFEQIFQVPCVCEELECAYYGSEACVFEIRSE